MSRAYKKSLFKYPSDSLTFLRLFTLHEKHALLHCPRFDASEFQVSMSSEIETLTSWVVLDRREFRPLSQSLRCIKIPGLSR